MTAATSVDRFRGLPGKVGGVEYLVLGEGEPVTVFAHGLAGSVSEIKPLAMPLTGTRVLFHFRGHGQSDPLDSGWDYDLLAEDLLAVVDEFSAMRVCGLSLGCGAIMRVLINEPARFERIGFVMPAILDVPRTGEPIERLAQLGIAIETNDVPAIVALLNDEIPEHVRRERVTQILVARRANELANLAPPAPRCVDVPVPDTSRLRRVHARSLILAQRDDRLHRVDIARQLTAVLPEAALHVLGPGGVFWTQVEQTRALLREHFCGS